MAPLLRDANDIRLLQDRVTSLASADVSDLFRLVGDLPPEAARTLVTEALPGIVSTYGEVSAAAAGEWFETLREREVGSSFRARLAGPVGVVPVERSVRFSAAHLFEGRPDLMELYLMGQVGMWVIQAARETIINSVDADPIGRGWQRVVRPGGCDFCRMLADRGGVYTRRSVWFASHTNCNCGVVPSWDPDLPEVDVKAYEVSERMEAVRRRAADTSDPAKQAQAQRVLQNHRQRTREYVKAFAEERRRGTG